MKVSQLKRVHVLMSSLKKSSLSVFTLKCPLELAFS